MQLLNKCSLSCWALGAEPYGSYHLQCCVTLAKILKFATSIYKMKDPLRGMSELVIFPQLICVASTVSWCLYGFPGRMVWCAIICTIANVSKFTEYVTVSRLFFTFAATSPHQEAKIILTKRATVECGSLIYWFILTTNMFCISLLSSAFANLINAYTQARVLDELRNTVLSN